MSRSRYAESSRPAYVSGHHQLVLAVALMALAITVVIPRSARAAFGPQVRAADLLDVGAQPLCVAAGDLNGDGLPDLVVGVDSTGGIAVLLHYQTGNSPSLYRPARTMYSNVPIGAGPVITDVSLVDMNKDGNLDLVAGSAANGTYTNQVWVMFGDGRGGFGSVTTYGISNPFHGVKTGDVNGDGWPDVVVLEDGMVEVRLGTGAGALGAAASYSTPTYVYNTMEVFDATGDGIADLVGAKSDGLTIWPGKADGKFDVSLPVVPTGLDPVFDTVFGFSHGDLNGDSVPDIVYDWTSNYFSGTPKVPHIGVLLGTGGGTFQAPVNYTLSGTLTGPSPVLLADMDGNGTTDVVTARQDNSKFSTIEIFPGNGAGTLGASTVYREPSYLSTDATHDRLAALVDVDGDGKLDIVMALRCSGPHFANGHSIAIVRNDGSGGLAQPLLSALGLQPTMSVVADFNRDGKPDLALADLVTSAVKVAPGDGSGTFASGSLAFMPSAVVSMTAGDFDRNGTVDLVTSDIYNPIQFVSGSPGGTLASPISTGAGGITHPRSMADMDRDGIPDLVVDAGAGQVAVLRGLGNGTFLPLPPQFLSVGSLNDLVLGDWNRDGYPDLAGVSTAGLGVMLGGPGGSLSAVNQLWVGLNWTAVCAGDFNRDGIPDLAARVSGDSPGTGRGIYIWLGDGTGNFTLGQTIPVLDTRGYTIEATDVNRDGRLDLVTEGVSYSTTANSPPDAAVEVYLGHGDGTFDGIPWADGLIGTINTAYGPATMADVDRDGTLDAIASIQTGPDVRISTIHINSSSKGNGLLAAGFGTTISSPRSVAVADMNRDGKLDVVTCAPTLGTGVVAVHLGDGSGTLGANQAITGSGPASKVAVADFNRDGIPDIAALNNTAPPFGIETLLGFGGGTVFQPPIHYFFNAGADFAVGDMNRDGIPDIVAATPDSIRILYGSPLPGRFTAGPGIPLPSCSHIELADLDQDGYLDVICACGSVKVAYGAPSGFRPLVATLPGPFTTCQTLCVADFNRDGYLDIEANQAGQWYILWGAAVSPFSTSAVTTLPFAPNDVKEGDAEANGTPYLYAARNPDQVEVLSVSPTGTIASVGSYVVKNQPGSIALGDFNRDGGLDVVSASPVDSALAVNLHGAGAATGVEAIAAAPPAHATLLQNFPNPFNPRTTIRYALPRAERVRLTVFDVQGRLVTTLQDGIEAAGNHAVSWDGRDSREEAEASGVYFCQLTAESGERDSKRMLLLK